MPLKLTKSIKPPGTPVTRSVINKKGEKVRRYYIIAQHNGQKFLKPITKTIYYQIKGKKVPGRKKSKAPVKSTKKRAPKKSHEYTDYENEYNGGWY